MLTALFYEMQVPMVLQVISCLLQTIYLTAESEAGRRALDKRLPTNLGIPATPRGSPVTVEDHPPSPVMFMQEFDQYLRLGLQSAARKQNMHGFGPI